MILPAKNPDDHSMPNIAKALWAFFFFFFLNLSLLGMCRVTKKGNFKEPDWNCGFPLLTRTCCSLEGFLRCQCFFSGGKACPENSPTSPTRV